MTLTTIWKNTMTINITVANQKGGVGKTTTAVALAHGLGLRDRRVMLVDFDPQGQCASALGMEQEPGVFNALVTNMDIQQWLRITERQNLDLLPGNRSTATAQIVINAEQRPIDAIKQLLKPLSGAYDYIIMDTAPSVGGIQERAVFAADLVLIPTAVDYLAMEGLAQISTMLTGLRDNHKWKGNLAGIIPTFYDDRTKESQKSLSELQEIFGEMTLHPIHRATVLRECTAEGKTVFEYAPQSRSSQEYEILTSTIIRL
jgi:chromosome partitioning protein